METGNQGQNKRQYNRKVEVQKIRVRTCSSNSTRIL